MGPLEQQFRSGPPSPRFAHPELGELAWCDEGCWRGEIIHGGAKVRVVISGDQAGPNIRLARAAVATVAKIGKLQEEAIALVEQELGTVAPMDPSMFSLVGVCYPHVDRPEEFWLELGVEGDDDGTWRVEFGPVVGGREG